MRALRMGVIKAIVEPWTKSHKNELSILENGGHAGGFFYRYPPDCLHLEPWYPQTHIWIHEPYEFIYGMPMTRIYMFSWNRTIFLKIKRHSCGQVYPCHWAEWAQCGPSGLFGQVISVLLAPSSHIPTLKRFKVLRLNSKIESKSLFSSSIVFAGYADRLRVWCVRAKIGH